MTDKQSNKESQLNKRRKLIKAGGTGLVAGGLLGSGIWSQPLVNTVVLPAHAQTSDDVVVEPSTFSGTVSGVTLQQFEHNEKSILDLFVAPANAGIEPLPPLTIDAYAVQTDDNAFDFQILVTSSDRCKLVTKESPTSSEIFAFIEVSGAGGSATIPFREICNGLTGASGSFNYAVSGENLSITDLGIISEAFTIQEQTLTLMPGGMPLMDPGECTVCDTTSAT